jgi:acetyl-CoA carboxylase biotin carboxyl carrier protein
MNTSDMERLIRLLRDTPEVGSIEIKGWFGRGIVITRNGYGGGPAPMYHVPAPAPPAPSHAEPHREARAETPAPPVSVSLLKEIKSPMVGTYYKAPEPGAEPYVKVGSRVAAGLTVCII